MTQWNTSGTGSASTSQREYSYNDADRLTSVVTKDPTTGANQSKTEFVYDGMSRLRISREYSWNNGAWTLTPNSEKRRVYDGMDVIQERDGANTPTVTYTRDGNIGGILAKSSAEGHFYFHYDGSGNVVGLSDVNQNPVANYDYDAFGNLMSSSGVQAMSNAYRYSTKESFGSVGLYNYGYRFYSPALGRWINRDPIRENGGFSLYHFVINNPTNSVDYYGLKDVPDTRSDEQKRIDESNAKAEDEKGRKDDPCLPCKPIILAPGDKWYGFNDKTFQQWFHKNWKQPGDPDASKEDISEAYGEWEKLGKPGPDQDSNRTQQLAKDAAKGVAVVGGGYVIYRCIRMVPSLVPPLWPTIPANAAIP